MLTTTRPSWFITVAADNFATHDYSFDLSSYDTLKDQIPRIRIGTAANKQSQP